MSNPTPTAPFNIQAAAEERARLLGYPPNGPWTVSVELPNGQSRSISKGIANRPIPSASQMARSSGYQEGSLDRVTAILLCLFLGGLGAHKFYLNRVGIGVAYFLCCWTFVPEFLSLIDLVELISMNDRQFHSEYNR